MVNLTQSELRERAERIRLVLTDVDGVLTDTGVYYSAEGEQLKRFSIRDGMGVERLRHSGIDFGVVTGENSACVRKRAEKLHARVIRLGISDKRAVLDELLKETGLAVTELGYIGDDVNDLAILRAIGESGLTAAPRDAIAAVAAEVHCVCQADGGHGAFRFFADWILGYRGVPEGTYLRGQ